MAMGNAPHISVIMPAYNAEKTLAVAVESVRAQSYGDWELIIVNDCSRDGTLELAKGYEKEDVRIRVLDNEENQGASGTRHRAVEAARGTWLAFLDSDDMWEPEKLQKQVDLAAEKDAQLVFTGSGFMDAQGNRIDWQLHVPEQIGYRKLLKQNLISNSSVLVRKDLFLEHEVTGEGLHEDFACWLRLLRTGKMAHGIDEPLLVYRLSPNSKSGNKLKAAKMNWNAYRAAGVNVFARCYYMVWYTVKGLLKYRHFSGKKGA